MSSFIRLSRGRTREEREYQLNKLDSGGRKITDCENYIQNGVLEGWCEEPIFDGRVYCTFVCDFFEKKIKKERK